MTTTRNSTTTRTLARTALSAAVVAAALAMAPMTASVARAQDGDAEARFHKAYETEVVDGKLADAARVYLALIEDTKAPAKIRAEAKFRFAVTAVLLGRSDEARMRLDEITNDAAAPDALRARARSYLDATKGVGVGTELDKKLQALVFELGRAPVSGAEASNPTVYRDFEVIGKPAAPFLRGLLAHPDVAIRRHAYRLLVRMGEPGMAEAWTPELNIYRETEQYLAARADEAAVFERKLEALDAATLKSVVERGLCPKVSASFLRNAKARGADAKTLVDLAWTSAKNDDVAQLQLEWLRDADRGLSGGAASNIAKLLARGPIAGIDAKTLLPDLVRAMSTFEWTLNWSPSAWNREKPKYGPGELIVFHGSMTAARACPVEVLVASLDGVIQTPEAATANQNSFSNVHCLVEALAIAVEERPPEGDLRRKYSDVLCRWAEAVGPLSSEWDSVKAGVSNHLRTAVARLPQDDAAAVIRRLYDAPAAQPHLFAYQALSHVTASDWELAMTLYRSADAAGRLTLENLCGLRAENPIPPADAKRASAILASLPEIALTWAATSGKNWPPIRQFHVCAAVAPAEDARAALVGIVEAISTVKSPEGYADYVSWLLLRGDDFDVPVWRDIFLPVADRIWPNLLVNSRARIVSRAVELIDVPGVSAFVASHAEDIPPSVSRRLAEAHATIPIESWVPRAQESAVRSINGKSIPPDVAISALAAMAPDPATANASVRTFARVIRGDASRDFYDRILSTAPLDRMQEAVFELDVGTGSPSSPAGLEGAIARLLAMEAPAPGALRRLVEALVARQPSERLFPAVRRLLASATPADVVAGIAAASSLGRADLLPALADKLDSMDVGVRQAARAAIDSIVELGKLKEEARKRADGR